MKRKVIVALVTLALLSMALTVEARHKALYTINNKALQDLTYTEMLDLIEATENCIPAALRRAAKELSLSDDFCVLNKNTRKYHKPECEAVLEIKRVHIDLTDSSRDELEEQGYKACKLCFPETKIPSP